MASLVGLLSYRTDTTLSLMTFWTALYDVSRPGGGSWIALVMSLLKMSNNGFWARNSGVTAPAFAEIVWLLACVWVGMLKILVVLSTSGPWSFSTAMYHAPSIDIAALPVL